MRARLLLSYWYYRSHPDLGGWLAGLPAGTSGWADSGAYSALTQGGSVALDEYCAWLHTNRQHLDAYAALDVIGDHTATAAHLQAMTDAGLRPVPVYHAGSPITELQRMLDDGHTYVALGNMSGASGQIMPWLVRCFQLAQPYGACFHGFGQTKRSILNDLPWLTADSSSWGSGHRYGTVHLWHPDKAAIMNVPLRDKRALYQHGALLRSHGCPPAQLAEDYHHRHVIAVNARAWARYERWLQARHQVQPPPGWEQLGTGTSIYLADLSADNLSHAAAAVEAEAAAA